MAELVRVYPRVHVGRLRPGEWADVPNDARLADWLEAGLVSLQGPRGEAPPAQLRPGRCCG